MIISSAASLRGSTFPCAGSKKNSARPACVPKSAAPEEYSLEAKKQRYLAPVVRERHARELAHIGDRDR